MSSPLAVLRWSFWSPETLDPTAWRTATGAAYPPRDAAIPPAHRRRMSTLAKVAVQAALDAVGDTKPDFLVFCSQHGELARTRELLSAIVARTELSPISFSQSVHNASAGLFTIITSSDAPATALAAGPATFAYGWIEAETLVARDAGKRVLLTCYDEALSPEYRPYSRQEQRPYALALLLGAASSGGFVLERGAAADEELAPMAPLFLEWALSSSPSYSVTAGGQGWMWRRVAT